ERDKALYPDLDEELQNFYGEITGIDRAVGKLREKLRAMNIEDNTVLWYLSDNGGLDMGWEKSTGGRGSKGQIYEGGLRVPSIIEWPARIQKHRETNVPAVTSDIYPTLLEITNLEMEEQPVLDGISLVPLIEGEMEERDQPVGFWQFPEGGRLVSSSKKMRELWRKQKAGESVDSSRLHLDAADITTRYPEDDFRGHAAWLDWPFKFHRIEDDSGNVRTELYNLEEDTMEQNDLSDENTSKVESMRTQLEKWQKSVIKSLNGRDYR
ncbi:MAG: sulfatase-like hydrolase/transferase, partial [Bacteroidales bacterium]|nr:sulfatase-like hydrolase/transferase [Bacteroidales bacterium]